MPSPLTTKDAIEKRRSIRKFKPEPIPDACVIELLDAARQAPSGCNAQPWRFKIVKGKSIRLQLARAAYNQAFIAQAPVVLVCCADIQAYLNGTVSGIQDLGKTGAVKADIVEILLGRADQKRAMTLDQIGPHIAFNVAIAVEHIVLRALDFGLGSCWIRLFDEHQIKKIFGWNDSLLVTALLPIGYPDEFPKPRKRVPIESIVLE